MGVPLVAGRLWSPDLSLILSWLPLQLILWLLLSAVTACRSTMWSRLPLGQLPLGSACCQPVASAPRGSAHVYGRGVWLRATPCPMTALTSMNWTTVRLSFRSTPPLFQVWRNDSAWWPLIRLYVPFEFFRAFFSFSFKFLGFGVSLFDSKGALLSAFCLYCCLGLYSLGATLGCS